MIDIRLVTENRLYPAILLEKFFPLRIRRALLSVCFVALIIVIAETIAVYSTTSLVTIPGFLFILQNEILLGAFFLFLALYILVYVYELYFRSLLGKEHQIAFHEKSVPPFDFTALSILHASEREGNVATAILDSSFGRGVMIRLGISPQEALQKVRHSQSDTEFTFTTLVSDSVLTPVDLIERLFDVDREFSNFLFSKGVQRDTLRASSRWVMDDIYRLENSRRWWLRKRLAKIPGIGKAWSTGYTFKLDRFGSDITAASVNSIFSDESPEVEQLETLLSKARDANVFIVDQSGSGGRDLVYALANEIYVGRVRPELEHKRVVVLHTEEVIASYEEKTRIEQAFFDLLGEAAEAGDIIIVIENLPAFIKSMKAVGSDAFALLDPFLESSAVQFVGIADADSFYDLEHSLPVVLGRFEKLSIEEPDTTHLLSILKSRTNKLEQSYNILFTYQALIAVSEAATRYFPNATMPDRAFDLLDEVVAFVPHKGGRPYSIREQDVLSYVKQKTNIPVGVIEEKERELLTTLEEVLHQSVVGQEEAVRVVSDAMRRARANVQASDRPIGTFLFLGPTGVGKTQTAKALAKVFFGDEDEMARIDMSEYSGIDAVERLIGSNRGGQSGTLEKLVKEKPYGVFLLDEFEKTTPEVHDLFLRIFDEGVFSDGRGHPLNIKNAIFIATSNAASQTIWQTVQQGGNLSEKKKEIIAELVATKTFKPELLNRFDAVVLFHPLSKEHVRAIAKLMLTAFGGRMEEQGIRISFDDDVASYIAEIGFDPRFGARPMRRVIQEKIEQMVAEKKIQGEIGKGSTFTITRSDFE